MYADLMIAEVSRDIVTPNKAFTLYMNPYNEDDIALYRSYYKASQAFAPLVTPLEIASINRLWASSARWYLLTKLCTDLQHYYNRNRLYMTTKQIGLMSTYHILNADECFNTKYMAGCAIMAEIAII